MFGSLGFSELIIILVIALIIFGPRKLPELGRSLGKTMVEFKKATSEVQRTIEDEINREAQPPSTSAPPAATAKPPETPHS